MRLLLIITACFFLSGSHAQDAIVLDENYPFKEGIYLTIDDFIHNKAVTPESINAVHSTKATKNFNNGRKDRARGLSWDFFGELIYSEKSSITLDSLSLELDNSGFETLIPGHNFFGLYINDRLYLNISPHQRPAGGQKPIFGRVAFIGGLMVLYIEYDFNQDAYHYVSDGDGNMVKGGGFQETVRSIVIFDLLQQRFEFADEKTFARKLENDEQLLNLYLSDQKRKKRIPYYADLYNKNNPVFLVPSKGGLDADNN